MNYWLHGVAKSRIRISGLRAYCYRIVLISKWTRFSGTTSNNESYCKMKPRPY